MGGRKEHKPDRKKGDRKIELQEILGIAGIPTITVICYGVAEVIKATALDNKWLPPICIVLGAILGVTALYVAPNIIPATDVLTALAIGIVSGGFATAVHQTIKQQINGKHTADPEER